MRWMYVGISESGRRSGEHEHVDRAVCPKYVQTTPPSSSVRHGNPAASSLSRKSHASFSVLNPSVSTTGMTCTAQTTSASSNSSTGLQQRLLMKAPFFGKIKVSEISVETNCLAIVSPSGILRTPEISDDSVVYLRNPAVAIFALAHALISGLIVCLLSSIATILGVSSYSQVGAAIIQSVTIAMVYVYLWIRYSHDYAVHEEGFLLFPYALTAYGIKSPSSLMPARTPAPLSKKGIIGFLDNGLLSLRERYESKTIRSRRVWRTLSEKMVHVDVAKRNSGNPPVLLMVLRWNARRVSAATLAESLRYILNWGCHKSFLQNDEASPVLKHLTTPLYQLAEVI